MAEVITPTNPDKNNQALKSNNFNSLSISESAPKPKDERGSRYQRVALSICKIIQPIVTKTYLFVYKRLNPPSDDNLLTSLAAKVITDETELLKVKPYLDALKKGIATPDVNNIALTGSYGSGKSTILKTFQYYNRQHQYLNISLAAFKESVESKRNNDDNVNENKDTSNELERAIEVSILQQMIYHVKPSQIPDSRFKRIVNITKFQVLKRATLLVAWVLSIVMLFKFDYINKLNPNTWCSSYSIDWLAVLIILVFIGGIGFFSNVIMALFDNSQINKVSIKGEIELGGKVDKSVFNQHIEEILYFFERNPFNVVIIEDLDRFENTLLFTKLREINTLINHALPVAQKVKFIYATRDELFKDMNERVKFFEFIIPVIPFINPSNAGEQMTKLIHSAKLETVLTNDFIQDVITFIDEIDMRLLINIFHEYLLYKEQLGENLVQDKLFAFIVYKNLYPADFSLLPKRKGSLYHVFASKSAYITSLTNEHENRVSELERKIKAIEDEIIKPIKELRAVYINKLITQLNSFHSFFISERQVNIDQVLDDEYFNFLKSNSDIIYYKYHSQYNRLEFILVQSGKRLSTIESQVSSEYSYDEREAHLRDRANGQVELLKMEKEKIRSEIEEIKSQNLSEILSKIPAESFVNDFTDNGLIRTLLFNGYLNENYEDYISLFHEVNLTREDLAFDRQLKSGAHTDFSQKLTKINNLINKVPAKYFSRENALNYDLTDYLLANESKYGSLLDSYFRLISQEKEKCFSFIMGFVDRNSAHVPIFIKILLATKKNFLFYLLEKSGVPDQRKRGLLKLAFEFSTFEDILQQHEFDSTQKYLENMPDFTAFANSLTNDHVLKSIIEQKDFKFINLKLEVTRNEWFDYVFNNNYYRLNKVNIAAVVAYINSTQGMSKLDVANYTTIIALGNEKLQTYIKTNLATYIETILLQDKNIKEDEEVIVEVLSHDDVPIEIKQRFALHQEQKINLLSAIVDTQLKSFLVANDKIVANWANISNYLECAEAEDIDKVLISFLNITTNYKSLGKQLLKTDIHDADMCERIIRMTIDSQMLSSDSYQDLIKAFPSDIIFENSQKLTYEKVVPLIKNKNLAFNRQNFDLLKTVDHKCAIMLLEVYLENFEKNFEPFVEDINDLIAVIESRVISIETKYEILKAKDHAIIIENSVLANLSCDVFAKQPHVRLQFEALQAMVSANNSIPSKIGLISKNIQHLSDEQLITLTRLIGNDYANIFNQKMTTLLINESEYKYFKELKDRGILFKVSYKRKEQVVVIERIDESQDSDHDHIS